MTCEDEEVTVGKAVPVQDSRHATFPLVHAGEAPTFLQWEPTSIFVCILPGGTEEEWCVLSIETSDIRHN
jgi:hypothetical protein